MIGIINRHMVEVLFKDIQEYFTDVLMSEIDLSKECAKRSIDRPGIKRIQTALDNAQEQTVSHLLSLYNEPDNEPLRKRLTILEDSMYLVLDRWVCKMGRVTFSHAKTFFKECIEQECNYDMLSIESQRRN